MNNEFKIGLSTNLLAGLDPSWDPRSGKTNILVPAEKAAMDTVVVKPVA